MLERQYGENVFICDGCADDLETGTSSFSKAQETLRSEGWRAEKIGDDWHHWCTNCQERRERKG